MLFYGLLGCGKIFLVWVVVGEFGVSFLEVMVVDVFDMWLGNVECNVCDLFVLVWVYVFCVVFFDEVDVLGCGW